MEQIIILAILGEALVNTLKPLYNPEKREVNIPAVLSLVVSVIICAAANADLFSLLELPLSVPFLGAIATGVIVSRGASFFHDLKDKLTV